MGSNMVRRLRHGGHECVVYDINKENVNALAQEGAIPAYTLETLVQSLPQPRTVWVMVPAGEATESMILTLKDCLDSNDIVIDGGNSFF